MKFPDAFDFRVDNLTPTASDTYKTQLHNALRSFEVLDCLERDAPTMQEVAQANPDASGDEVLQAYNAVMVFRQKSQKSFDIAAPKLAACILRKPLTLSEITQINLWSSTSEALMLYDWIMTNLDISIGKPQDLIRAQYATDGCATLPPLPCRCLVPDTMLSQDDAACRQHEKTLPHSQP